MDVVEEKIQELLALAEPLRALDEDDPAKAPLAGIVDEVNRLRARQERQALQSAGVVAKPAAATVEGADAPNTEPPTQRRKPGPKPKGGKQ